MENVFEYAQNVIYSARINKCEAETLVEMIRFYEQCKSLREISLDSIHLSNPITQGAVFKEFDYSALNNLRRISIGRTSSSP